MNSPRCDSGPVFLRPSLCCADNAARSQDPRDCYDAASCNLPFSHPHLWGSPGDDRPALCNQEEDGLHSKRFIQTELYRMHSFKKPVIQ